MPLPGNENDSPAPYSRTRRGPPITSASLRAVPSSTCTPTQDPQWSWNPVSRGSHHVLSQASECSCPPEELEGALSRSLERGEVDEAGRGPRERGALVGGQVVIRIARARSKRVTSTTASF